MKQNPLNMMPNNEWVCSAMDYCIPSKELSVITIINCWIYLTASNSGLTAFRISFPVPVPRIRSINKIKKTAVHLILTAVIVLCQYNSQPCRGAKIALAKSVERNELL